MDLAGAFPLLQKVMVKLHGSVHHVGSEVVDDCYTFRVSDLSFVVSWGRAKWVCTDVLEFETLNLEISLQLRHCCS